MKNHPQKEGNRKCIEKIKTEASAEAHVKCTR